MLKNKPSSSHEINFYNGVPLQLQVRDVIRKEVLSRKLVDETGKIATEYELMDRFGVSRVTVRNALQMLVDEGVITRERGRGTFVRTNHPENWTGRLMGFTEIIKESGFVPNAEVLNSGLLNRNDDDFDICKEKLNTDNVWNLTRLRFADEHPIAVEYAFFPSSYGAMLENEDLKSIAIYQFFEKELDIYFKEANQIISAVNADEQIAEMLNTKIGEALLYIERSTKTSQGDPVEFLKAVYRPDYFQYLITLSRNGI
ncbi:GntR family transcriptional regulator [Lentibacillus persicus]|uniref:GntR family transcriptional regulator n=1 Tax=Lentibacillus persicus TaxID=640948 RepID=A0A1I1VXT4_9BACI|nr:GntR family transcriptional regulator [Lentibacillus persicus]SFD87579.1 GntR family transcriptional regulator [Lentibacillus persicus]